MERTQIRVLIVEDSPLARQMLTTVINSDPQLQVVGVATNGQEAVELAPKLRPHLITMDIKMPKMDGLEATKQIMASCPTPILIVSSSVFKGGMDLAFKALAYGALDVIEKNAFEVAGDVGPAAADLITRIKTLAHVKVITHPLARLERHHRVMSGPIATPPLREQRLVAMAASTGGPQTLLEILKALPKEFPCGLVIVQHIASGFSQGLVEWLDAECQIAVQLASDHAKIQPGVAYVAPTGVQMRVVNGGVIRLTDEGPYDGQKPSGTLLFESVAQVYGERAVGVILTGMGSDGAVGLKHLKAAHGHVIAQDEATSIIFGMPKTAIELGVVDEILPLDRIAEAIVKAVTPLRERVVQ